MFDALVLAHSLRLNGEERTDAVEEVADHDAGDLHVVLLLGNGIDLEVFIQRVFENIEGTLVDVMIHVVFDEAVEAIKSLDSAYDASRRLQMAEDPFAHIS